MGLTRRTPGRRPVCFALDRTPRSAARRTTRGSSVALQTTRPGLHVERSSSVLARPTLATDPCRHGSGAPLHQRRSISRRSSWSGLAARRRGVVGRGRRSCRDGRRAAGTQRLRWREAAANTLIVRIVSPARRQGVHEGAWWPGTATSPSAVQKRLRRHAPDLAMIACPTGPISPVVEHVGGRPPAPSPPSPRCAGLAARFQHAAVVGSVSHRAPSPTAPRQEVCAQNFPTSARCGPVGRKDGRCAGSSGRGIAEGAVTATQSASAPTTPPRPWPHRPNHDTESSSARVTTIRARTTTTSVGLTVIRRRPSRRSPRPEAALAQARGH